MSTVQGVLVNQGGFLRETVSDLHLEVLNLMRLCFDQLFRLPRVILQRLAITDKGNAFVQLGVVSIQPYPNFYTCFYT